MNYGFFSCLTQLITSSVKRYAVKSCQFFRRNLLFRRIFIIFKGLNSVAERAAALNVLLPTMYVDRFGPEHLRKLQRMHEDLIRRLNHLTTMTNPIVQGIHDAQGKFMRTSIDLAGYTLQMMGEGLQYGSIALAASGLGAEAGAVVYGVSKVFNWSGTAIRGSLDMYDGNYEDVIKSAGSVFLFNGLSRIGTIGKLPIHQQYLWDIILTPYNEAFNQLIE